MVGKLVGKNALSLQKAHILDLSERKWRRGWDSNPRYACTHNGFRDRPNRPLWHLSDRGRPYRGASLERQKGPKSLEIRRFRPLTWGPARVYSALFSAGLLGPPRCFAHRM